MTQNKCLIYRSNSAPYCDKCFNCTKSQGNILDESVNNKELDKIIISEQFGNVLIYKPKLQSLLKQAELRAKIEALTDFAQAHFMKTRQHGYDEENYQLVRYEVGILENELAELKKLNLGDK